jgi:CheY-like chemotaxis protein
MVEQPETARSPEASVIHLLIADDHEVVRSGLRWTLEAHPGWKVIAEASDGKEAIAKAVETRPHVAIIDFSLPKVNGIEVTRQIRARVPTAEVLIFSMHDSAILKSQALEAGARTYLVKSDATAHLIAAVRAATSLQDQTRDRPSEAEIRATLEVMLLNKIFSISPQLAAFLRFVVEAELRGDRTFIKGYTIAVEALGRGEDFDPTRDLIVRVEAGRLRRALRQYYDGPGATDQVVIDVPLGRYVPTFRYRGVEQPAPKLSAMRSFGAT